jgi:hypothetical protein
MSSSSNEATHPRCSVEGYPDRPGRASYKEGESWGIIAKLLSESIHRKSRNAVAIAEGGRGGEVRYLGEFPATESSTRKLVGKFVVKYNKLTFCYEAGPTGYGRYRLIRSHSGGSLTYAQETRRAGEDVPTRFCGYCGPTLPPSSRATRGGAPTR